MSQAVATASRHPVAHLGADARGTFLTRTYGHLFFALGAFTLIEVGLFRSGIAETMARSMLGVNWLWILGGFMVVGWIASHAAHRAVSPAVQYAALAGFVLAEAIIFVPLLYVAQSVAPGAIQSAATVSLLAFAGLTWIGHATGKDFSFLGGLLRWGGILALVVIVAGVLFGFQLGTFFSIAMIGFAGAAILYDTSNILHHYPEDRYVAAALELFASVALMFWYVLRLFIALRD